MEIWKKLLADTFDKRLIRLENRTISQTNDLKFTKDVFGKQGIMVERWSSLKIEDKPKKVMVRNKTAENIKNIKRDYSADPVSKTKVKNTDIDNKKEVKPHTSTKAKQNNPIKNTKDQTPNKENNDEDSHKNIIPHKRIIKNNPMPDRSKTPENRIFHKTKKPDNNTNTNTNNVISKKKNEKTKLSTIPSTSRLDKKVETKNKNISIPPEKSNTTPKENKNVKTSLNEKSNQQEIINAKAIINNNSHNISKETLEDHENIITSPEKHPQDFDLDEIEINDWNTINDIIPDSPKSGIKNPNVLNKAIWESEMFHNEEHIVVISLFLDLKDKLSLFSTKRQYKKLLADEINLLKVNFENNFDIMDASSIEDKINKIKSTSTEKTILNEPQNFQLSRASTKAIEMLNEERNNKIFYQPQLTPESSEIILVYRVFFIFINERALMNISDDDLFWNTASQYILKNNNNSTGNFFLNSANRLSFSPQTMYLIKKFFGNQLENMKPTYYSKICGTTGFVSFWLKEALEYCGWIINEKKNKAVLLLNFYEYLKEIYERVNMYIDILKE